MGLFKDIFLSKQDKKVIDIYNEIYDWKNYNDFIVAHKHYLQGIDTRFNLRFSTQIIDEVPFNILSKLLERGISESNIVFIFSQYVVFYILKDEVPRKSRINDKVLLAIAENITSFIIPYSSKVTPEFSHQIDRNLDILKVLDPRSFMTESNRKISSKKLASSLGCSIKDIKQTVFDQLDSMHATEEVLSSLKDKHHITKLAQAKEYNMLPDDTPAGLLIEIINEFIESLKQDSGNEKVFGELTKRVEDLMSELIEAHRTGNMTRVKELIESNPGFLDAFVECKPSVKPVLQNQIKLQDFLDELQ